MFWKKKPKLPITPKDQIWVEESLTFLKESFGEELLLSVRTVEPTKAFFNRDFDESEEDAKFILARCIQLMQIAEDKIILEFYRDNTQTLHDGTIVTTAADVMGKSSGAAGTYRKEGGKAIIRINRGQLKNPESLIATISHELAHEKLLGENRIIENDEYLTDLTAIVFGFGVFIANAKFQFNSGINSGFGWQMQSQGYLPEQVTAYAMASLALKKKETIYPYQNYLDTSVATYFEDSLAFLGGDENSSDTAMFWTKTMDTDSISVYEIASPLPADNTLFGNQELESLQQELKKACYSGNFQQAEEVLVKRVSPNFTTIGGSPLAIAVKGNKLEVVECLLHYGADINYSNSEDMMDVLPLMAACKNENLGMMNYLLDKGAEIDRVGGNGNSILETAVETGNRELVQFLIDKGANLEIKSGYFMSFDKTPLTAAVMNNDTEMVSFLVKNGAKTKPIRKLARHEIHPKMVKFLKTRKYL